jgi:hypothetical protein
LPSKTISKVVGGSIFFPDHLTARTDFDLACRASDHMALHIDLEL